MKANIVRREAFTVLGVQERFPQGAGDFEGIWQRFMVYKDQIRPFSTDDAYYGVSFGTE